MRRREGSENDTKKFHPDNPAHGLLRLGNRLVKKGGQHRHRGPGQRAKGGGGGGAGAGDAARYWGRVLGGHRGTVVRTREDHRERSGSRPEW